jgi:hypothetical protein
MKDIYEDMPESFPLTAQFSTQRAPITLKMAYDDGDDENKMSPRLSESEKDWLKKFSNAVLNVAKENEIELPALSEIKVFYAKRGEYYYENATGHLGEIPIFFVGDSAGGTDYKLGLSLGRGLLAAEHIVAKWRENTFKWDDTLKLYSIYWSNVIEREFEQNDPDLIARNDCVAFKYLMRLRSVDGVQLNELDDYVEMMSDEEKRETRKTFYFEEFFVQSCIIAINLIANNCKYSNLIR